MLHALMYLLKSKYCINFLIKLFLIIYVKKICRLHYKIKLCRHVIIQRFPLSNLLDIYSKNIIIYVKFFEFKKSF